LVYLTLGFEAIMATKSDRDFSGNQLCSFVTEFQQEI